MKKSSMIKLAAGAAAVLLMSTSAQAGYTMKKKVGDIDTKLTFYGFAQLEAVGGDGMKIKESGSVAKANSDVAFRAQRIRLGWNYVAGKAFAKVFLDFNQKNDPGDAGSDATDGAAMPGMIKDAFVGYLADDAFFVKLGLMKMPNGMSFTMPGWNLDITERGLDKSLAMERNTGLMISGRDIGFGNNGKVNGFEMGHERPWIGFGYDIMVANQASRSAAANSIEFGGNAYAVRGMFDYTEKLHIEASYAVSENADGLNALTTNGEDYSNYNIGIDSNLQELSLKAEYFDAHNITGIKNYDEQVWTATAGYLVTPTLELVGKHMQGTAKNPASATNSKSSELGNTYLGFNFFINPPYEGFSRMEKRNRNQHKIAFNYIVASGNGATEVAADKWSGLSGYRADAFIAQYQIKF
ncbi:hypothetical protein SMGD1_0057 [Sulfurimonas gotlandica GD1]|jgi:hypothetical protein|uniref:Porin domain-containing protein n=1 Tax=Sulfurimonas gotlandica (strain DSM 19862 / JCM 16533 / GD1) TaxID=929558 RepID=B6BLD0_SULGG|nr:porin [Sulfurimonas gotlandica]EDZ61956.1 hypothetical protein CBGD1_2535 [Sulfurimonas gotlandica GD1]EHP28584.1 hypothetical protein SMGD1_0057 [Sulfurimonas gotlandica GD1]